MVLQSSLRTGHHPATWAPSSLPLVLLGLFLLLAVLGSGHLSVSTGLREPSSLFPASGGSSSGPITSAMLYLIPKTSIPVSGVASPGLGGCCCFSCRGSCPCAPSGAFSFACGEVPPTRASLLSSRDRAPRPSLVQLLLRLIPSPRGSLRIGPRSHHRVRLLGPLTETDLVVHGLDARSHSRGQSPHLLSGAVCVVRLRYKSQPRLACCSLVQTIIIPS